MARTIQLDITEMSSMSFNSIQLTSEVNEACRHKQLTWSPNIPVLILETLKIYYQVQRFDIYYRVGIKKYLSGKSLFTKISFQTE